MKEEQDCDYYMRTFLKVRENRRDNQEWTIQRNWQHRVHKTKTNKTKQKQHKNVLETTMRKETQLM